MAESKFNLSVVIQQAANELKRSKTKAVSFAVLLVVALVVFSRLLLSSSSPSQAGAAVRPHTSAVTASSLSRRVINVPGDDGQEDQQQTVEKDRYILHLGRDFTRDLFAPNLELFPLERPLAPVDVVTSGETSQEQTAQEQAVEQLVRAQARSLALQSTMISQNPIAIINGQVLRVGEWTNGFEVTEITARACKVSKSGVTVILKMKESTDNE